MGDLRDWILPDPLGLFGGKDKDTPPPAAAPVQPQYPIITHVSDPGPNTAPAAKRKRASGSATTDSILGDERLGGY